MVVNGPKGLCCLNGLKGFEGSKVSYAMNTHTLVLCVQTAKQTDPSVIPSPLARETIQIGETTSVT